MMTRQLHDQLAKEYLEALLKPLGNVTISKDVKSEVQEIDVSFEPTTTLPKNSGSCGTFMVETQITKI